MERLMRRCLLSVSLLGLALSAFAGDYLLPLEGRQEFAVTINARGAELTGICIVKTDETGTKGAVVNEFGVHALDFTLTADRQKVKLLNVMPAMNRWYVRRVVRKDLKYLFSATERSQSKGPRKVVGEADGSVTLENTRYKLTYSFKPIKQEENEITQ